MQHASPLRTLVPRTSTSSTAVRQNWTTGLTQRTISSTAAGTRTGLRRSFSSSPGFTISASRPPEVALRVVSLPATMSST